MTRNTNHSDRDGHRCGVNRGWSLRLVCLLAAATLALETSVAMGATSPATKLPAWRPPNVSKIVASVEYAHTNAKRIQAIDAVLKALGIGVYTPKGRRVVGGFERNAHGIYLYDFEVKFIAEQLGRMQMGSFDQMAKQFVKAGIRLSGKQMTGPNLAAAVSAGIKRLSSQPEARTPGGALAAVVRRLGLARNVDLISPPQASAMVLDAMQRILIAIDVTRAFTGQDKPAAAVSTAISDSSVAHDSPCGSNSFGGGSSYGASITSMVLTGGKAAAGAFIHVVFDGLDGVAIAYSVGVQAVKKQLNGAFGTNGPNSAKPMNFQVKVSMLDDYQKDLNIPCGRLPGYQFPKQGGIKGVKVIWKPDEVGPGHLSYLGTLPCSRDCKTYTDGSGISTMTFQPDDEYLPNVGSKVFVAGAAEADAYPQEAAHNILGSVSEVMGVTKYAFVGWLVSYHDPGGYRVDLPAQTYSVGPATVTWASHGLEACLASEKHDVPHPLRPYWRGPLHPGGPNAKVGSGDTVLGFQGTWSGQPVPSENHPSPWWGDLKETFKAHGHTVSTDWAPEPIPIGFDTTQQYSDNNVKSQALWSFTGPTLHAHVTLTYEVPLNQQHTFDVPVTQANYCGSGAS